MVAFMGYGGSCPDYTVGDARFANSFIGYGDDARIANRLRVSCFCLAVTVTDTGFVTLTVTEILEKYASAGGNWPSSVKISLVNYYKIE